MGVCERGVISRGEMSEMMCDEDELLLGMVLVLFDDELVEMGTMDA
jgi:hypothetical protein